MNTISRTYRRNTGLLALMIVSSLVCISPIFAQSIVLQEVVMGNVVVSSPTSVKMLPGFHTVKGSAFRAYIGAVAGTNPIYTVPAPSSGALPAAGSSGSNYIKTIVYREAKTSIPSTAFKHLEEISYFDGLGRPNQKISVGASPTGEDIIQPVLYDDYGREAKKTLPYTASKTGEFRSGVTETTVNTYYGSIATEEGIIQDGRAYTQIVFDNSPLNRIVTQTGPGTAWTSKPVTINYLTNVSGDNVTGWTVGSSGSFTSFTYPANSLFIIETIDEQGNATREYKDKEGKVVQKSSKLEGNWLRTAYIYDDLGLLRCVVPPKAGNPNTETGLCYYYSYDGLKRMTEKKIPGGGTIKMVYDIRDRLRCTQNSVQDISNEWSFTQYDELNRPVVTGIIKNYDKTAAEVKSAVDAITDLNETRNNSASYQGYNHASFPTSSLTTEVQNVTYYDNYDFISGMSLNDSLEYDIAGYNTGDFNFLSNKIDPSPIGRVTGTMTRALSPVDGYTVGDQLLFSTNYYDKFGHLLRSISENHLKGKDVVSNLYENITYLLTKSRQQHFNGGPTLSIAIEKTFGYDHAGRLLSSVEQVNDQTPFTLNAMKYNKVGQLLIKYLHSNQTSGSRTFTQKVDYQYNIRGWLTRINDPSLTGENDLFGMQLSYNAPVDLGTLGSSATACYNGNISGMKWGIKNDVPAIRGYIFAYDGLNRLTTNNYAEGSSLNTNTGFYAESITQYDANGNIMKLERKYNNILVDNLTYNYTAASNRISTITDAGTANTSIDDYPGNSGTYVYDANGNMTYDGSRNATLTYHNTINLPSSADFGNNNRIFYHYTATGTKLIKHVVESGLNKSFTHYIGNIVYEGGKISYIITEEGRLVAALVGSVRKFVPEYNLKDHLGNNRVTFMGSYLGGGTVDIVQASNYYPFGLTFSQTNTNTDPDYSKNKYLYNGKELQDDRFGSTFFGLLDYGARFYDPQIGRWHTVDPSAERDHAYSPYCYAANNPVRYIDPDGRWFDDKNIRKANRIEKRETKRIAKLENQRDKLSAQGKDIGDLNERIGQLHQSVADVRWMKSDTKVEYKYASANSKNNPAGTGNPNTTVTGTDQSTGATTQITMFVGNMGNQVHESRHGGDAARGTLNVSNSSTNYGVQDEVSAYKAQYSYDGSLIYRGYVSSQSLMQVLQRGISIQEANKRITSTITNINSITPQVVNSMADGAFPLLNYIYPMQFSNPAQWNNN